MRIKVIRIYNISSLKIPGGRNRKMWLENGEGVTCEREKKEAQDDIIPCIIEDTGVSPEPLDRVKPGFT
jgi:hypothetical protein